MYGIEPDLFTKGLTSAYIPLSAAIISKKIASVMEEVSHQVGAFSHDYSYSGHPISLAAANAVLDIVDGTIGVKICYSLSRTSVLKRNAFHYLQGWHNLKSW